MVTLSSMSPVVGTELTARLADLDGGETGEMWQWARSMDMMTWDDIAGATAAAYTPMAVDGGYYLRAMVSYTDGHGTGKSEMAMTANTVTTVQGQAGTVTLSSMRPVVGTELTAMLDDPDGGVTGTMWQWARSMDMTTWDDIAGATADAYTPMAMDDGYYLRAMVMYTDGHGAGKSAMMATTNMVTAADEDPLVARYDADNSGTIEKPEVIAAINDYLDNEADAPSKDDVIRLITLYLFG